MKIETQIAKFDQSIEDFVHCVASLNEELFLKRFNHWSPRDVVAHLIGWNRYIIEGSNQIRRGELPSYDIDPGEDYSKVNAVLVLEYSSTDRQELLDELQVHKGAIITIQNTVDELIEDYDIHKERIKEWVRRESSQRQD
jgi:hypothetical protein